MQKINSGGNGLFIKKTDRYLPKFWPYYKKSKNISLWDLENKKYLDMAQMEWVLVF